MRSWWLNSLGSITSSSRRGLCSTWCSRSDPRSPGPPVTTPGTQVTRSFIVLSKLAVIYPENCWSTWRSASKKEQYFLLPGAQRRSVWKQVNTKPVCMYLFPVWCLYLCLGNCGAPQNLGSPTLVTGNETMEINTTSPATEFWEWVFISKGVLWVKSVA